MKLTKKNMAGAYLEMVSITVTVALMISLSGSIFGKVIMGSVGLIYDGLKVYMIYQTKRAYKNRSRKSLFWMIPFLLFLMAVALIASLSYSLSTMDDQKARNFKKQEEAIPLELVEQQRDLEIDLVTATTELSILEGQVNSYQSERDSKLNQIDKLESGWITASDRLSGAAMASRESLTDISSTYALKAGEVARIENELDALNARIEIMKMDAVGSNGVASEEFTRVAEFFGLDVERFLGWFMISLLFGVEFGVFILIAPEEQVKEIKKIVIKSDEKVVDDLDKLIDAMLSLGKKKIPGVKTLSAMTGISVPRVSAYRAAMIQSGLLESQQGATAAVYGPREMKEKARAIRDKIDF